MSTAAVGAALGPIAGGVLLEHWSWPAAFLVNVPVMAAALVAAALLLPESRSADPGVLDPASVAFSVLGMVGFVYAVKQLAEDGLEALPLAAAALVLGAGGANDGFGDRVLRALFHRGDFRQHLRPFKTCRENKVGQFRAALGHGAGLVQRHDLDRVQLL